MGSNPYRRLSLLGFAHPVVGPPFQIHEKTALHCGLEKHFCKNILEQYSFIYFGYVKELYIELLYEKKKMTPEIWGVIISASHFSKRVIH